ncbi:hypothetical protein H6G17_21145 [Chroococcidiopsis sp. FACHB-1243]|uniref:hypothetical protein n=1 Tax=Chroococcidiopsis sp. [FACHB-1243] TaxID=2692781 RepID=UPI00177F5E1B|nr:hypothetical protein [Chroococcidiopsis sp. [FACHB-1243]]MBD2307981.1 hypothetical protein [Chroococcidiopsis sp. [FACHB-1243]]
MNEDLLSKPVEFLLNPPQQVRVGFEQRFIVKARGVFAKPARTTPIADRTYSHLYTLENKFL